MDNTLEMDQTILKKNLEITKLKQNIDYMVSKSIDQRITPEMIDTLDITLGLLLAYLPIKGQSETHNKHIEDFKVLIKHIKSI